MTPRASPRVRVACSGAFAFLTACHAAEQASQIQREPPPAIAVQTAAVAERPMPQF